MTEAEEILFRSEQSALYHMKAVQGIRTLTHYQERITNALMKYNRISVKACHGVGKTFWAARVVLWAVPTFPFCKVITTAPTGRQVKKLLWTEIRSGHKRSLMPLGGELLTTEWNIDDDWFAIGYSPQKEAGDENVSSSFQGFHAPKMIFVIDEATGVAKPVWDQIEGMTTGSDFKIIAIGNPTSKSCVFFQTFAGKKSLLWHNESINVFDSPNLIANNVTDEKQLVQELELLEKMDFEEQIQQLDSYKTPNKHIVTMRWVMERALEWGIDHPLFRSKVLAEFPEEDENALFTLTGVTEATKRIDPMNKKIERRIWGVDPARFGTDKTVITEMHDYVVKKVTKITKKRTTYVSNVLKKMIRDAAADNIKAEHILILIDGVGLGSGVVDQLHDAAKAGIINADVIEIGFGETKVLSDHDKLHYANLKAKIFQLLSRDINAKIKLPTEESEHEVYQAQLPTIIYDFQKGTSKMIIEDKKSYKKRTGMKSPDESDSLGIANYGNHVKLRNKYQGPRMTRA